MKLHSVPRAFTLVEVIVSVLLISIISAASWMAVSVLNPTAQVSSNRIKAENLLTKSQEEVYQAAQTQFDTIEQCSFASDNICGFEDISLQFPDFTRTLSFISQNSAQLKTARISIFWNELNSPQTLDALVLLTSPKQSLPGNVIGEITNATTNALVEGVTIALKNLGTSEEATATSSAAYLDRPDDKKVNYSFAEPDTRRFVLKTGTWRLTATKEGFKPTVPPDINIDSNLEVVVDFKMEPAPENAHIKGQIFDGTTPAKFNNNSQINLYEGGVLSKTTKNVGDFDFVINFPENKPRQFTLATMGAFNSGLVGNFSCVYPWAADGWSSSIVRTDSVECANPWVGNSSTDRIKVSPGENIVVNIPLVKTPTATLQGYVRDQNEQAIAGAEIYVNWHNGNVWQNKPQGKTDGTGFYSVVVPAEQSLFQNSTDFYVRVWAQAKGSFIQCCEEATTSVRKSGTLSVGPLYSGDISSKDFIIDTSAQQQECGNAQGRVINDRDSSAGVPNANIQMSLQANTTDSNGKYVYSCASKEVAFRLPVGLTNVVVESNNFYPYTSAGNKYYKSQPAVKIEKDQNLTVPDIGVWPIGKGRIHGIVLNAKTDTPIPNIEIKLMLSAATSVMTVITDSKGEFTLDSVEETWPPSGTANKHYVETIRNHYFTAAETALYEGYQGDEFTLKAGDDIKVEIQLVPRGAV